MRSYTLLGRNGKVEHVGITNNPSRRSAQHESSGKSGRMSVETSGMPRRSARRWEGATLACSRKNNQGKNPRYDKTRSGGRRF